MLGEVEMTENLSRGLGIVTSRSDVVGYQGFGRESFLHLQGEYEGSMVLPHHYTASQPQRPRPEERISSAGQNYSAFYGARSFVKCSEN
jgi:hypothetical protein